MGQQQAFKELIETTLASNPYNVTFNVELFNRDEIRFYDTDEDGNKTRFVPTMIGDFIGEYLNVPNTSSTNVETSITFDVFIDYQNTYDDNITNEIANVQYENTLNAINYLRQSLLAKYFPLGTSYLFMGGEDSSFVIDPVITLSPRVIYLDFTPKNSDSENIFNQDTATDPSIVKNATHIRFEYTTGSFIEVPYTVDVNKRIAIYHNGNDWIIEDSDGNSDSVTTAYSTTSSFDFTIGETTGLECIMKRLSISSQTITSFNFDNLELSLDGFNVDIDTWDNKDLINNSGTQSINDTSVINNCILWSEDGNAVFSFGTLTPINDIYSPDGNFLYQTFELPISSFVSSDVLFGNNFEYYLDGLQIFPIDRQITLATEGGSAQKINSNESEFIVEESLREHTLSFYYIPSKKLNSILKHVVSGDTAQNTTYELVVQYPFFNVTYDVVLDSGGTQPNINTISDFTLTFKKKDSSLT